MCAQALLGLPWFAALDLLPLALLLLALPVCIDCLSSYMGFAHMLATLAGAKAPPHGAAGHPVRNNDDGVEPESLQCMQLSSASPQQTGACGHCCNCMEQSSAAGQQRGCMQLFFFTLTVDTLVVFQ